MYAAKFCSPEAEDDFVTAQVRVIIDRQDSVGFDGTVRQEAIVETVAFRLHNLLKQPS